MTNLELGQTYEFEVLDIVENSIGAKKLQLKYGNRTTYRCSPFPFQEEDMPSVVYCKVVKIDPINEMPILSQDKGKFLAENYTQGDYAFKVVDVLPDENTKVNYYKLEDRFGFTHRCYYKGEQEYFAGDVKCFEVSQIDVEKGRLDLKCIQYSTPTSTTQIAGAKIQIETNENSAFGPESQTVEHKTSIVFDPGKSEPDIDVQLPKIVQTIGAFLNTDGGTLNIGVNNYGVPVGMVNDYAHLNDGDDKYNGSYKASTDHYELKIRNAVKRYLTERASMNISFEFPSIYKGTVCVIHIKPLKRPVFFKNTFLFVRTGNQNTLLKNDEITSFVQDRLQVLLREIIDTDDITFKGDGISAKDLEAMIQRYFHQQPFVTPETTTESMTVQVPKDQDGAPQNQEVWNYFTYYESGEYSIQKTPVIANDILYQVCVYKSQKNQRIILCYDNGFVVNVEPSKIYNSKYKGQRRPRGWNTSAKLMNVFVANTYDMVGAISKDFAGRNYVKVHNVGDLGASVQAMNSKGNTFISPKLGNVLEYKYIPANHRHIIPNMIVPKADITLTLGIPETMPQYLNEITYVKKI